MGGLTLEGGERGSLQDSRHCDGSIDYIWSLAHLYTLSSTEFMSNTLNSGLLWRREHNIVTAPDMIQCTHNRTNCSHVPLVHSMNQLLHFRCIP